MRSLVTISRDEDGMFVAECPLIPGCVSQGKTEEEAERNIREAIRECLAVRAELGLLDRYQASCSDKHSRSTPAR